MKCTNCGNELPEGATVCPECGVNADTIENTTEIATENTTEIATENTKKKAAKSKDPQPAATAAVDERNSVVGTSGFFGWKILFAIPIIGWIACLIMAFAAKNKNIRHFAAASAMWVAIRIALYVGVFFTLRWAAESIMESFNEQLGTDYESFSEILEELTDIRGMMEDYSEYSDYFDGGLPSLDDYDDIFNYNEGIDEIFGGFGGDDYNIEDYYDDIEDYYNEMEDEIEDYLEEEGLYNDGDL